MFKLYKSVQFFFQLIENSQTPLTIELYLDSVNSVFAFYVPLLN